MYGSAAVLLGRHVALWAHQGGSHVSALSSTCSGPGMLRMQRCPVYTPGFWWDGDMLGSERWWHRGDGGSSSGLDRGGGDDSRVGLKMGAPGLHAGGGRRPELLDSLLGPAQGEDGRDKCEQEGQRAARARHVKWKVTQGREAVAVDHFSRGRHQLPEQCASTSKQRPPHKEDSSVQLVRSSALGLMLLPGAGDAIATSFRPLVEGVKAMHLPDWLIEWGHPGNMAVVLLVMGGYGAYLGWSIRLNAGDRAVISEARGKHPAIMSAMLIFFCIGASGGLQSLLVQGKPILESPHAVTGFVGLALLTIQALLGLAIKGGAPELRSAHAILGSTTMALFLVHMVFGIQLGLSA